MEAVKIRLKLERIPTSFVIPEIVNDSKKPKDSKIYFPHIFGSITLLLKVWKTVQILHIIKAATSLCDCSSMVCAI